MPKEKKYVKLEAGERKAVRKAGAMKTARQSGIVTKIYSGERGGLFTNTGPKSTVPGAETRTKSTPSVDVKRQAATPESQVYNREQYIKQGAINQGEFEKTRLGSRMVKKATKSIAKAEKKGQDVELKKNKLQQGIRTDANTPIKGLAPGRVRRGTVTFDKQKKAEEKKQKLSADAKRTKKVESKKQKFDNSFDAKLAKSEAIGARRGERQAKRLARKNS